MGTKLDIFINTHTIFKFSITSFISLKYLCFDKTDRQLP